jgi:hypothetical protein
MTVTTAPRIISDVVFHEVSPDWCRESLTLKLGFATVIGTVLGLISIGAATSAAKAGNTGNGTLTLDATTPVLAGARSGIYAVRFTAATTFTVEDPDGNVIGSGVNGTAFSDDLKFVTAAGGTAFVAGDGFDITVAAAGVDANGVGKVVPLDLAAVDGSQASYAVAIQEREISAADQPVLVVARGALVDPDMLVWPAGITAPQKAAALSTLRARGIIARTSI